MSKLKTNILLLLVALIWGFAFVAQKAGMDYVGPFTFNTARFFIGGFILLPCIFFLDRQRVRLNVAKPAWDKPVILGGLCCGIPLFFGSFLQQLALQRSSVGKVGFITALYILFVPIFGIFLKRKVSANVWLGVMTAVVGMYLLCIGEGFSIELGDILTILAAFAFSIQILVIDHFSPKVDGVRMSCLQFFVSGILSSVFMAALETPTLSGLFQGALPLLYAGVLSCGVAYTLQIVAQKHAAPTVAALIMSLESVFSVLGGWLILGQTLSLRESFGCILMFIAILFAQISLPAKKAKLPVH